MMTHKKDQDAAVEAYVRKQLRARPEFLNQDTLDRLASVHAKELIELGAKSAAQPQGGLESMTTTCCFSTPGSSGSPGNQLSDS